jgi:threonine dehydrogenase-like Zn-dependent dehydrogenase
VGRLATTLVPCRLVRALWLTNESVRLRTDTPEPYVEGEALVRVTLAGVCNTDLEMVRGYYPFTGVPGHEFVGVVERADGAPEWVGQRVAGEINATCGTCAACRAGRRPHCERRTVLGLIGRDGTFAERLALPVGNLHAVPDHVPDDAAVFTEPLAAALHVRDHVGIAAGDRVLVVGDGKLGHLVALALAPTGCALQVATRVPRERPVLRARGIAVLASEDVPEASADVVVECTGQPGGLAVARRAVRPAGPNVLKSTNRGEAPFDFTRLVVDEVAIVGSRCGPFPPALQALAAGAVDPRPLIAARYALDDGLAALDAAAEPGVLKVLIAP